MRVVAVACSAFLLSTSDFKSVAQEPVTSVMGLLTLGAVLDQFEDTANNIVETAGEEARGVAIEAGAQMRLVIANARVAYADSLDKTVDAVSRERRQTFNDTLAVLSKIEKSAVSGLSSVEEIAELSGTAIDGLPFASGIPRIRSISPVYVTESQAKRGVEVVARGLSLRSEKPTVLVDGNWSASRKVVQYLS
jgi:hypothetical protein